MVTLAERYPMIDNVMYMCCKGLPFQEPIDDDDTTVDEEDETNEDNTEDDGNDDDDTNVGDGDTTMMIRPDTYILDT
ncbi:hypothetical protein H5410_026875 [Solanum commersonii]|uniref:Uncharacterized protein n=1 Tax=Solanum commersonii TaxID=4109 RepID=A0A9J5Z0C1_SOLCO|nr:hypothetical protein H5410_026875 [Solanum commersonii]